MTDLYVDLNGAWLDKHRDEGRKTALEHDDKNKTNICWESIEAEVEEFDLAKGQLSIHLNATETIGWISVHIPLAEETKLLIGLLEYAIKQVNKFKTMIEAAKD